MTREEFLQLIQPEIKNIAQGYPEAEDFLKCVTNAKGATLFTAVRHVIPKLAEKNIGGRELAFFWTVAEKDIMIFGKLIFVVDVLTIRLMKLLRNYDGLAPFFKEMVADLKQQAIKAGVYRENKEDYNSEEGWN